MTTRRFFPIATLVMLLTLAGSLRPLNAQEEVPTLIPPTLVPQPAAGNIDALPSESAIAQIMRTGVVRVGVLYNEPPFGELNVRGQVSGFEPDLARAMVEAWGAQIEFVQVTRQTAIDTLIAGDVEMLMAALPHMRALDARVEFSHTYYPTMQAMLVRDADSVQRLDEMAGRRIGVVLGTRSEEALAYWQERSGLFIQPQTYFTLDIAIAALVNGEIDGVVANRVRLSSAVPAPGIVRLLDQPVMPEPFAVAMRRQDIHMRNLVNRTLQYLEAQGRIDEIHRASFNGIAYSSANFTRWQNIGDSPVGPDQYGQDIPFPAQYVIPRMEANGAVRIAGLRDLPQDAPESQRRLDAANRAVIDAMVARWGVQVSYVPGDDPIDLVASGAADLAIGVAADWNAAERVDFTGDYFQRGELLLVPANSNINGFAELRGRTVGIFAGEPNAAARVTALGEQARAIIRNTFIITREQDAIFGMLADLNYNAVFGDSLRIVPLLQAQPNDVRIITNEDSEPRWYSRQTLHMALPRNDIDFRLLVEYTLQEIALDGTLSSAVSGITPPNGLTLIEIWPGSREYLGYNLNFSG
jgi:polar amino acid transport system substrate-binding protein